MFNTTITANDSWVPTFDGGWIRLSTVTSFEVYDVRDDSTDDLGFAAFARAGGAFRLSSSFPKREDAVAWLAALVKEACTIKHGKF